MKKPKPISQELDVVLKQVYKRINEIELENTVKKEEVNNFYKKAELVKEKYLSKNYS